MVLHAAWGPRGLVLDLLSVQSLGKLRHPGNNPLKAPKESVPLTPASLQATSHTGWGPVRACPQGVGPPLA